MGRPDIAINTVGKVLKKPLTEISEAEYDEMSAVNAKTAFFFLKEAGRHVNDNGKVCTLVTSLLGAFTPFYAAYAGSKAPVEHYTRAVSYTHLDVYKRQVVMDALQPEEHRHHTDIEDQHHRGRDPVHPASARAGVVVERRGYIGLGRAGHGIRAG